MSQRDKGKRGRENMTMINICEREFMKNREIPLIAILHNIFNILPEGSVVNLEVVELY